MREKPVREQPPVRRIVCLTTGGTIASRYDPSAAGFTPQVAGRALVSASGVAAGEPLLPVEVVEFYNRPSGHLTPADWAALAAEMRRRAAEDPECAFVITHGTDTLEEAAFFLWLTLPPGCGPVVLTGAQRPADHPEPDGPRNLADALRVAATPEARRYGPLVVFAGQIHRARHVTKWHTLQLEAFASPGPGPAGLVQEGEVLWLPAAAGSATAFDEKLAQLLPYDPTRREEAVLIVPAWSGAGPDLTDAARRLGTRGLVIEALGAGNVPPGVAEAMQRAIAAGVRVAVTTRVPSGPVAPLYAYEGGGKRLEQLGAELAGDLPAQKARLWLMLALGNGRY